MNCKFPKYFSMNCYYFWRKFKYNSQFNLQQFLNRILKFLFPASEKTLLPRFRARLGRNHAFLEGFPDILVHEAVHGPTPFRLMFLEPQKLIVVLHHFSSFQVFSIFVKVKRRQRYKRRISKSSLTRSSESLFFITILFKSPTQTNSFFTAMAHFAWSWCVENLNPATSLSATLYTLLPEEVQFEG